MLLVLTGIPTVSYSVENSADIEAAIDYDGGANITEEKKIQSDNVGEVDAKVVSSENGDVSAR